MIMKFPRNPRSFSLLHRHNLLRQLVHPFLGLPETAPLRVNRFPIYLDPLLQHRRVHMPGRTREAIGHGSPC